MPPLVLNKRKWCKSLFPRFTVETVHICKCFSEVWSEFHRCMSAWFVQCDILVFLIFSRAPQRMGNRSDFPVLICPSRCNSPQSSQFWVAKHDAVDLVERDREFLQISFWDISSVHCGPQNALSVRRFRRAEHRGVFPSWWRNTEMERAPSRHWLKNLTGLAFNQEMSTIDHSLIPIKNAFWALHFWNCFA